MACRGVMNVDKNPAYPAGVEALKAEGVIPRRVALRQRKYLNKCHRTGPPYSEETSLAGQGLWFLPERVADPTRNRNGAHDPEGPSEMVGKKGYERPNSLHRLAARPRYLTLFGHLTAFAAAEIPSPKLRNETEFCLPTGRRAMPQDIWQAALAA